MPHEQLTWDEAKRARTLAGRGLDFAEAWAVFADTHVEIRDRRRDYGEDRRIVVGRLRGRLVVLVYVPRGEGRHIISMRKANAREQARFRTDVTQGR